jgi:hypothetical protein
MVHLARLVPLFDGAVQGRTSVAFIVLGIGNQTVSPESLLPYSLATAHRSPRASRCLVTIRPIALQSPIKVALPN